jgi:FAD dependent oxidoreductase TIGR03364
LCADPRQAIARLPHWLHETYGVELRFGTVVDSISLPLVQTSCGQTFCVERALVCSGIDFQTLFPEAFRNSEIRRCKLQMMRTVPQPGGWRLGPHLAGGLTLCHYGAFQACPSLPRLRQRFESQYPAMLHHGIHVMASQNHLGEVVIGDSHEYDDAIEPFDKVEIDTLILDYLHGLVRLPEWTIAGRWHGLYAKHPTRPLFTAQPQPGVTILVAPGGAGMTLSLGQAEQWWDGTVGPATRS